MGVVPEDEQEAPDASEQGLICEEQGYVKIAIENGHRNSGFE